jgi:purine-binding chemotaxis protein CheW
MNNRYCTLHVGDLLLGVAVELVDEVIAEVAITRVPLAEPSVVGLINLRGQIVTAVDARVRLGLAPRADAEGKNVVIRATHEAVSLVVDREGDVVDLSDVDVQPLPENVDAAIRNFITGACKVDERLLLLLDAPRLLAVGSD